MSFLMPSLTQMIKVPIAYKGFVKKAFSFQLVALGWSLTLDKFLLILLIQINTSYF